MTRADDELALLLVDGDNLLHRVRGRRDETGVAWLIPRLRRSLPAGAAAVVMLDGPPSATERPRMRAAPGVEFRHSGRIDADTAIVEVLSAQPFSERARTVVVTDDRGLTERARHAGGLVRSVDWLVARMTTTGVRGSTLGGGRPPGPEEGAARGDDEDRPPWQPGRGATRKRGNPRRTRRMR